MPLQHVLVNRGDTSKEVLHDTSTLLFVRLCVRLVWYSLVGSQQDVCGVSKRRGGAGIGPCLSSILPVTTAKPPWGRARECTDERKLVRCEREYGGGWRGWQVTSKDGREKRAEGGWTMRKERDGERGDRWLLQWERQEVEGRQKKRWGSALIFHTRQFLHTWREVSDSKLSPFTLTLSATRFILWLPLADARALWQWKTKNGYNTEKMSIIEVNRNCFVFFP